MNKKLLALLTLTLLTAASLPAAELYVSPTGLDTNAGTISKPWKTFQKAAGAAKPGDTVNLRAGTYNELVTITAQGTATGRITFRNYGTESVTISGSGKTVSTSISSIIRLGNRNYITLQGLKVANLSTTKAGLVPTGIYVYTTAGYSSTGVEIKGCEVSNIQHNDATAWSWDANAHGIAVYGVSTLGLTNVVLDGNKVHDLRLGASEAVSLNGNVSSFKVTNNTVWNCNNIGIDFIGYEGTCANVALDRARNGVCTGNNVYNIDSQSNPAYGGNFAAKFDSEDDRNATRAAPAIYVDGGDNIVIERNTMSTSNFGLSLSSEHASRTTSNCIARNNMIVRNHVGGIVLGGAETSNGGTSNCLVTNNTLAYNDTVAFGGGSVLVQNNVTATKIRNNIMVSNAATSNYTPQFILFSAKTGSFAANDINYNLYAGAPATNLEFLWKGVAKSSFSAWKAIGQDTASIFTTSAGFADAAKGNYKLIATSIARDKADQAMVASAGSTDHEGLARVAGTQLDIGADEANF